MAQLTQSRCTHTPHTHILIHSPAPSMHQLSRHCANWLDVLLKIVSVLSPCLPSEKIVPFQLRVPAGRQQEVAHNEGGRGARSHGGGGWGLGLIHFMPAAPVLHSKQLFSLQRSIVTSSSSSSLSSSSSVGETHTTFSHRQASGEVHRIESLLGSNAALRCVFCVFV